MKSYFRPEIDAMTGYVPGEQPKLQNLIKLNTNENPYPPSPKAAEFLRNFDYSKLRRYPNPMADDLRDAIAQRNGMSRENIVVGNGSDDVLTMIFRCFTDKERPMAMLYPSYSLYAELAAMQNAQVIKIALDPDTFELPENLLEQAAPANLLMLTRPNAPTGNTFDYDTVSNICRNFDGIVVIDEAYADFAPDNCMGLTKELDNVIVMRTFSKSYALAGLRLGYAVGAEHLIDGLMKVKDSYNSDMLAQGLGLASYCDEEYFQTRCREVAEEREKLSASLQELGFNVIPSAANFLFAAPPGGDGKKCFDFLREHAIIVRYFPGEVTGKYVRITIGTPQEDQILLDTLKELYR